MPRNVPTTVMVMMMVTGLVWIAKLEIRRKGFLVFF